MAARTRTTIAVHGGLSMASMVLGHHQKAARIVRRAALRRKGRRNLSSIQEAKPKPVHTLRTRARSPVLNFQAAGSTHIRRQNSNVAGIVQSGERAGQQRHPLRLLTSPAWGILAPDTAKGSHIHRSERSSDRDRSRIRASCRLYRDPLSCSFLIAVLQGVWIYQLGRPSTILNHLPGERRSASTEAGPVFQFSVQRMERAPRLTANAPNESLFAKVVQQIEAVI
jgi:hypothetical protein